MSHRTALAVTACLLVVGCSEQAEPVATPRSVVPAASPTVSVAPDPVPTAAVVTSRPAERAAFPADTSRDVGTASGGPLTVTAVRVARQDGFDRVVFELDGRRPGVPGWRVEYVDNPSRDGSGEPVDVEGEATLVVYLDGAGYPADTGAEEASGVQVPAGTRIVRDVELGSVFEGVYEAFVGTSRKAPFRVFRLTDPTRVVVDVRHS